MQKIRINRYIASCTEISRRKADALIAQGKVCINSRNACVGDIVNPDTDIIIVKGKKVSQKQKLYLAFYKPKNVVTTMHDPEGRPSIKDFIPNRYKGVFPVGRLDFDAQGLIILTNDGDFSQALHHPSFKIPKVYEVGIFPEATDEKIGKMKQGIMLDEGLARAVAIQKMRQKGDVTYLRITLEQGIKNQIKRMFEAVKIDVQHIKRISVGPVKLGAMKPGEIHPLTKTEIETVYKLLKKHKKA